MDKAFTYMNRCLQLAKLGAGRVAPNPMVGAVLVFEDRIIGEGYHQQYGQAHAEVNCIASVHPDDHRLIPHCTMYVSLEPCAHYGKTPPCADLIIQHQIPHVVVGCRDPFEAVNGKGIEKLIAAGIKVTDDVLGNACRELNKKFFTFHTKQRPFITLKWAQSNNAAIAGKHSLPLTISNDYTNRWVHKLRSESMGIMVGTNTAFIDNPSLTTRHWPGKNPVRIVLDKELRVPASHSIFNKESNTIIFNNHKQDASDSTCIYHQLTSGKAIIANMMEALCQYNIQSILVEGGTKLLQSFIDAGVWDEAYIISNTTLFIEDGLPAPVLKNSQLQNDFHIETDHIQFYKHL